MVSIIRQEDQLPLGWADCTTCTKSPVFDFRSWKAIFQSDYCPLQAMVMLLYCTLQLTLRYNTVI